MAEPRRLKELADAINQRARFPAEPHVVALSGGADSAALAFIADLDSRTKPRCVHVHHGLPASDRLAEAAREIAEMLDMACDVVSVDVPEGPSPEAMAREVRYRELESAVARDENLLLGHTRNDQAETVLLNLIRGAGLRGLSGMPYQRTSRMYRPFLDVFREETRELATLHALPFVDDPTNTDLELRRNFVRLELMPRMEELNPNMVDSLARTAEHVRGDSEFLDQLHPAPIATDGGTARVATGILFTLDPPLRARAIAALVGTFREKAAVSAAELARVAEVLSGASAGAELEGGLTVTKQGAYLVVTPGDVR
ncbi:MAG: tRNA lysidine(34) synthetase TilS [Acidimicrobiia bacterium]